MAFTHCSSFVATASRDKRVKVYSIKDDQLCLVTEKTYKQSVTAIAFSSSEDSKDSLMIVGLENGQIFLEMLSSGEEGVTLDSVGMVGKHIGPCQQVNRIRVRRGRKSGQWEE